MDQSFYPEIEAGDTVLFAPAPSSQDCQFRPGVVLVAKTLSCDIMVYGGEMRRDCLHVDDPQCKKTKAWSEPGRGVFKLSRHEQQRRNEESARLLDRKTVAEVESDLCRIEQRQNELESNLERIVLNQSAGRPGRPMQGGRKTNPK